MTMTPEQKREPRPVVIPSVPFGPDGVPVDQADANYFRSAAKKIRHHKSNGNKFAGRNLTETVARLCEAAADALEATPDTPDENDRETLKRIAEVASVQHLKESIAEYKSATSPEKEPDDWELEFWHAGYKRGALEMIDHQLSRAAVPEATEPEWEYGCYRKRFEGITGIDGGIAVYGSPDALGEKITHRRPKLPPWELLPVPERGEG